MKTGFRTVSPITGSKRGSIALEFRKFVARDRLLFAECQLDLCFGEEIKKGHHPVCSFAEILVRVLVAKNWVSQKQLLLGVGPGVVAGVWCVDFHALGVPLVEGPMN